MSNKQKVGRGSRKKGRMKAWCLAYRNRQQRERNKARRLMRHMLRFPDDAIADVALANLPEFNR